MNDSEAARFALHRPWFYGTHTSWRAATMGALGEQEKVLVRTGVTPDAREAVLEDAAVEELVRDLAHDGTPRAVF